MSDIITLSSSDEEDVQPPPKKRIKPSPVDDLSIIPNSKKISDVVILSDDEIEDNVNKNCVKNGQVQVSLGISIDEKDDNYSITIQDDQNETPVTVSKVKDCIQINNHNNEVEGIKEVNHSIIIDENSSAGSSGKENKSENETVKIHEFSGPSTSTIPVYNTLENFLQVCEDSIAGSQYEDLKDNFLTLRKHYKKCGAKLSESSNFLKLIEENIIRAQKSPATAVISFNEILQYSKEVSGTEIVEVSEEDRLKLKKLEKTIKSLLMRIKQLENSELNFDDEEDSTYLQLDRFINRLNQVHKKYCELLNKNPYNGRITYEKLDFVDSEYNEINRAISRKYKNNQEFPSYYEMEEYIRKVVNEHDLDMPESKIKNESVRCFKKLGELLQNRRKKELYDAHYLYIRDNEDPARGDKSLDSTLKQNFAEAQVKIEKICEEFTVKEKLGEEAVLSEEEDSDRSDEEDSENEDEDRN